jgi:hypothetical protein
MTSKRWSLSDRLNPEVLMKLFAVDFPPVEPINTSLGILLLVLGLGTSLFVFGKRCILRRSSPDAMERSLPNWTFFVSLLCGGLAALTGILLLVGWKWFAVWMLFGK